MSRKTARLELATAAVVRWCHGAIMRAVRFVICLAAVTAAIFVPAVAFAHPGHGIVGTASLLHYLIEPQHAPVLGLPIALAVLAVRSWRTRKTSPDA